MLLIDARNARERLMHAESASSDIDEAEALAAKRNELEGLVERLLTVIRSNTLLQGRGIPLSPTPDIHKVKQQISQNNARFVESPKATTLVDKQRWSKLVLALTELAAKAETQQQQDWKNYFNSKLFGGVSPEQHRQTIVQALPANKSALLRYTDLYRCFQQYRNSIPGTVVALEEVHSCSIQLEEIQKQFVVNKDLPPPVKAFFNATSTGTGASLDFLTLEVIEWLRTNNMLANYVVRAR